MQRVQESAPLMAPTVEAPWWRHAMVWLVIGGPAVVVVAALATAVIAVRGADPVVSAPVVTPSGGVAVELPAIQARNQGAAPTNPPRKP